MLYDFVFYIIIKKIFVESATSYEHEIGTLKMIGNNLICVIILMRRVTSVVRLV